MGKTRILLFELLSYAFTQHALRELRAHTSMWTEALRANSPLGLLGRAGHEGTRAMASEITERQAHWPFHLAGDSGARLFGHRAWLSWRLLALLELPSLTLSELPTLSKDLQVLIEATRSQPETAETVSANTVQEILLRFSRDPACNGIKGKWLRNALKLTRHVEDSVVEKRLEHAVAHAFTVLQSLFNERGEHAAAPISSRFVACAALFLHLQDSHCKERLGSWQPFRVHGQVRASHERHHNAQALRHQRSARR
jgi:hypothetical protein